MNFTVLSQVVDALLKPWKGVGKLSGKTVCVARIQQSVNDLRDLSTVSGISGQTFAKGLFLQAAAVWSVYRSLLHFFSFIIALHQLVTCCLLLQRISRLNCWRRLLFTSSVHLTGSCMQYSAVACIYGRILIFGSSNLSPEICTWQYSWRRAIQSIYARSPRPKIKFYLISGGVNLSWRTGNGIQAQQLDVPVRSEGIDDTRLLQEMGTAHPPDLSSDSSEAVDVSTTGPTQPRATILPR